MKTKVFLLATACFTFIFNTLPAQITFQKTFSGMGYSVQQTKDSGYIMIGWTDLKTAGQNDIALIRTNMDGDTLWTKTYGGTKAEQGFSVEQTRDGGFILAGHSQSFGNANDEIYIIKTNSNGDTTWTKALGFGHIDIGHGIHQTKDGGYIIQAMTDTFAGYNDLYLIKTDSAGTVLWSKIYTSNYWNESYSFQPTSDGGYIIAGDYAIGPGNYDIYLFKADSNGNKLWAKTYGGPANDQAFCVRQTSDSGYIVAGIAQSFGAGGMDAYLIKTNAMGDTLWTKTYGGTDNDMAFSVVQTRDGGYLFTGATYSFGTNGDVYLVKTDRNGNVTWSRNFGGQYGDQGNCIQKTNDGGYVIAGYCNLGLATKMLLIKTDSTGNSFCDERNDTTITNFAATQVANAATTLFIIPPVLKNTSTVIGRGVSDSTICYACNLPVNLSGLPDTVCVNGTSSNLTGSPPGGKFSGAGITGNIFTPSAAGAGLHQIIYNYSYSSACISSDTATVYVKLCNTSIDELKERTSLIIFPNPFSDELLLKGTKQNGIILISDVSGKEILMQSSSNGNTRIDTRKLSPGFYLFNYTDKDVTVKNTLVKFR